MIVAHSLALTVLLRRSVYLHILQSKAFAARARIS
jgi:hypothetical protein